MKITTVYVYLKNNNWFVRFKGKKENLPLPFSGDDYDFIGIVSELERNILPPNSEIICAVSRDDLIKNEQHVQSLYFYGFDVCNLKHS